MFGALKGKTTELVHQHQKFAHQSGIGQGKKGPQIFLHYGVQKKNIAPYYSILYP